MAFNRLGSGMWRRKPEVEESTTRARIHLQNHRFAAFINFAPTLHAQQYRIQLCARINTRVREDSWSQHPREEEFLLGTRLQMARNRYFRQ